MIITKLTPYTNEEIEKRKEEFDVYVKTVIDLEKKICSAGMDRHFEGKQILLDEGSRRNQIWGGGVNLETKEIDFNSFINIRPHDNNPKNEILDPEIRRKYETLTRYFFNEIL